MARVTRGGWRSSRVRVGLSASGDSEISRKNGLALGHGYAVAKTVEVEDTNGTQGQASENQVGDYLFPFLAFELPHRGPDDADLMA